MWAKQPRQVAPQPDGMHLQIATVGTRLDEWAAMREVYEALAGFDEPAQTRIIEAVRRRLGDELSARRHAADERHPLDMT